MRRLVISLSVATLLLIGSVVAGSPVGGTAGRPQTVPSTEAAVATTELAVASSAAPAASEAPAGPISVIELAPGVTAEIFAGAPSDRAPDQTVYVARFVFEAGSEIFPHSHPGTTVLGVESGTFGWTLLEGTAHVVRGAAAGNTEVEDVTEPGTEVILEVGDAIYYEDDVVHTARGAGDDQTVLLATGVFTPGEPLLMPVDMDMAPTTSAP
jgi:quercetin dioxygenase-like cupin family protein